MKIKNEWEPEATVARFGGARRQAESEDGKEEGGGGKRDEDREGNLFNTDDFDICYNTDFKLLFVL